MEETNVAERKRPVVKTELAGEYSTAEKKKQDLCFVHPTAIVEEGCKIGEETKIWQFAHVCGYAEIGRNVSIGEGVYIGPEVEIGNGCKIGNHVSIVEGVVIEDDVFVGAGTVFSNVVNPRAFLNRRHAFQGTALARGVTVGGNCTIICGHNLGRYCFIGAGAVVTHDVEPFSLQVGVPAKHLCWVSKEGVPQINRPGM